MGEWQGCILFRNLVVLEQSLSTDDPKMLTNVSPFVHSSGEAKMQHTKWKKILRPRKMGFQKPFTKNAVDMGTGNRERKHETTI